MRMPLPTTRDPNLDALAQRCIVEAGVAPSAALGFAARHGATWRLAVGCAGRAGTRNTEPTTLFDYASVSKPFIAVSYARLLEAGRLDERSTLGDYVKECRGTSSAHLSLELLLSHRGGLEGHVALYAPLLARRALSRGDALRRAAAAQRHEATARAPVAAPAGGFPPVYSDLGYLLAGEALSRSTRVPLDALVRTLVSDPLGLDLGSARQWHEAPGFLERVAPTEHVRFRGGLLRGVVHDENAWAFGGHGLCGQAGLFGAVGDLLTFGAALLDAHAGREARFLSQRTVQMLVAERPGGSLRLGFDGKSNEASAAGKRASPRTFGHLGFTGTSLWCDPDADFVTVLLTNRVSPTRENIRIRSARPVVHDALYEQGRPVSP